MNYEALDAAILEAISTSSHATFTTLLVAPAVNREAQRAVDAGKAWRVVDRRLQSLRKAGRIDYHRRDGWRLK